MQNPIGEADLEWILHRNREGTEQLRFRNSSVRKMMNNNFEIRTMTIEDYQGVHDLWMTIKGFAIRSIDDSKEGVASFLKRNPTTSVVAVADGKIVGSILCGHDGRRGCLYHVCVDEAYRMHGIGKSMVVFCMQW